MNTPQRIKQGWKNKKIKNKKIFKILSLFITEELKDVDFKERQVNDLVETETVISYSSLLNLTKATSINNAINLKLLEIIKEVYHIRLIFLDSNIDLIKNTLRILFQLNSKVSINMSQLNLLPELESRVQGSGANLDSGVNYEQLKCDSNSGVIQGLDQSACLWSGNLLNSHLCIYTNNTNSFQFFNPSFHVSGLLKFIRKLNSSDCIVDEFKKNSKEFTGKLCRSNDTTFASGDMLLCCLCFGKVENKQIEETNPEKKFILVEIKSQQDCSYDVLIYALDSSPSSILSKFCLGLILRENKKFETSDSNTNDENSNSCEWNEVDELLRRVQGYENKKHLVINIERFFKSEGREGSQKLVTEKSDTSNESKENKANVKAILEKKEKGESDMILDFLVKKSKNESSSGNTSGCGVSNKKISIKAAGNDSNNIVAGAGEKKKMSNLALAKKRRAEMMNKK